MGKNKNKFKRGSQKVNSKCGNLWRTCTTSSRDLPPLDKQISNDRLGELFPNENANSACYNAEVGSGHIEINNFQNPFARMTNVSSDYGIRHLLTQTLTSRNEPFPHTNPKCIDLSNDDVVGEEEVIDLTETAKKSVDGDASEPAVIDISEEEFRGNPESEEVCVIGTYPRTSRDLPSSNNQISNNGLRALMSCRGNIVVKNNLKLKMKNIKSKLKKKRKNMLKVEAKRKFLYSQALQSRCKENFCDIGSNVCVNSPLRLPSSGLRPIVIDGNNVAYKNSNYHFCCKRLQICINYFKEKGHKVTAFVPQFRMSARKNDDPKLLRKLEKQGLVVFTPSKEIDGKKIVPYDDRFIVQTAVLQGGIIVSRDNYRDLLEENPAWAQTINYRTLGFTWVDDVLMFPEDPLGEFGPKLEEFLRFH